ncbi:CoA transferase [Pseudonocardia sp. KRD-184]|uniref:CoA transferase n=1 Tax=Pseudonocardia oceani TaxID=2792013 RepID=A0ABS6U4E2_9PSEU|nr:CoA transferase [Pseudonocardia oceani]MBW0088443.1 CoA transferase [Pseudonocardia oceani]MBW0096994.1 CoA transferase [Pseudonocardia oceani]MBW0110154.1 CoA transferase [Pseudonocardia oceani]MBW0121621.1 CoA transferase [Pseudonocardia oceani]MBW0127089.1 CoA transferase [Pseudonocardia oceani]
MTTDGPDDPVVDLPLAGMRVVEISSFVAAPLGGMTLAQLGADVIRIDPLGGAPDHHRWPLAPSGTSLYWAGLNKGKKSVSVDFRSAEGRELVARLVAGSGPGGGIVLTNAVGRDWLRYEALAAHRRDLIHVQIEGHHDGTPAVDYTVNAAVGFPMVTGPEGHADPVNHVLPAWDIACGLYAALGILAADRRRRITGVGQRMSVALYDVALAAAGNLGFLAEAQVGRIVRKRYGNYLYGGFARDFATKDGRRVMVVALTARHWADLLTATDLVDVISALETSLGTDFSNEEDRFEYREVLAGLFSRWFARNDLAAVEAALQGTSLLWSTYSTFSELVGDAAAEPGATGPAGIAANPMMHLIDQPGVGPHLAPGLPVTLAGMDRKPDRAPVLGEDTLPVLSGLGLSDGELADLLERRVISAGRARAEGH